MKYVFLLLLFMACGTTKVYNIPDTIQSEDDRLIGFHAFNDGGYLEITKVSDGRYLIWSQLTITRNSDDSLAYHPNISQGPYNLREDNKIAYRFYGRYDRVNNNVKQDGTSYKLHDIHYTEVYIFMAEDNLLTIHIKIHKYAFFTSAVVVDRTLKENRYE